MWEIIHSKSWSLTFIYKRACARTPKGEDFEVKHKMLFSDGTKIETWWLLCNYLYW